jgi:hypothetical protein
LIRREVDWPQAGGSTARPLETKGLETESSGAARVRPVSRDLDRGKPVGAFVAAAKVLLTHCTPLSGR